jgi:hypothetical protein
MPSCIQSGVSGNDNVHFNNPSGLCVDGKVGVSYNGEFDNNRIKIFPLYSFTYLHTIGPALLGLSGTQDSLSCPVGLNVDNRGLLFVTDFSNHRVLVLNKRTGMITN